MHALSTIVDLFPLVADIFVPVDPDAPDALKGPLNNVVAVVKYGVLVVILIIALASLGSGVRSYQGGESPIGKFAGVGGAIVAAVVVLNIEAIFNFIAA